MPIPKPHNEESKKDFISRCMKDEIMQGEYPNQSQRAAICATAWVKEEFKEKE